eukprot:3123077-Rhodomonas_salina.2
MAVFPALTEEHEPPGSSTACLSSASSAEREWEEGFTGSGCFFFSKNTLPAEVQRVQRSEKRGEWNAEFVENVVDEPIKWGSSGRTLSSARNKSYVPHSCRCASYCLNLFRNFEIPMTREIPVMPCAAILSLYSRCGSFTIRHLEAVCPILVLDIA